MKILLLSAILLMFGFPIFGQDAVENTLEKEVEKRMEEYKKSNITVAQDILNRYVNDQVMGMILQKQTGSDIKLINPTSANMAVIRSPFEECTDSMKKSMRHHQTHIMAVQLIEYGVKENPNDSDFDEFFISVMFHESVPNALVSICIKNKTKTPSTTFVVFNTVVEGLVIKTYKDRYKI